MPESPSRIRSARNLDPAVPSLRVTSLDDSIQHCAEACEMHVEDPDGNVLRFGSDSHPHEPFGEWRDHRRAKHARGAEPAGPPSGRA